MNKLHTEYVNEIAKIICGKTKDLSIIDCAEESNNNLCKMGVCKIDEKTKEQLKYIISNLNTNIFLSACPGSGKTEVVGLKAAYEIAKWDSKFSGIAFLTFTNNAKDVIWDRVHDYLGISKLCFPHFIGTVDSWIHSYIVQPYAFKIIDYSGQNGDYSIRIVDESSKSRFLNNYKTKYGHLRRGRIQANQFHFNLMTGDVQFYSGQRSTSLSQNQNVVEIEQWELEDFHQTKDKFNNDGFASYVDMEDICYRLISKTGIGNQVVKRFPKIIIDECQDLSDRQLTIFQQLLNIGISLHFIGDLDQSIYEFKEVYPYKINNFCIENNFSEMNLSNNFRSSQPIVDVNDRLVGKSKTFSKKNTLIENTCVCLIYKKNELNRLPNVFLEFISNIDNNIISISNSAILSRSYSLIQKIRGSSKVEENSTYFLPYSIHLWIKKATLSFSQLSEVIECFGKFLSEKVIHGCSFNSRQQYKPEFINSSVLWRRIITRLLNHFVNHCYFTNLDKNWATYAKEVRKNFDQIFIMVIKSENIVLPKNVEISVKFRAPSGKAKRNVLDTIPVAPSSLKTNIRITTIHKVKGETLDAVLFVSSPDNRGQGGGYWENWLENPKNENARLAYVASSRPRHLLIWAIPESSISDGRLKKIKDLGFDILNMGLEEWKEYGIN